MNVRRPLPPRGTPGGGRGGGAPPSDKPSQEPAAKKSTEPPPAKKPAEPPPAKKPAEPPPAKKPAEPPPAKKPAEPPPAKKSTEPPPAKRPAEPPPAKKSTEPPPAKKPPVKKSTEPPPAKKSTEPPGAKKPTKASDAEPSRSGGGSTAISAAGRAYTNIAGQFSNQLMRVASERVKDKEMADALADINKIMDAHAFLSNPKQYSAQFIADYMIDGAFGKFARQLAAAEAQFFSTYPDVRSFHQQSLGGGGTSLDDLEKRYDQAFRNLRLPSARKTLATVFFMLDITDKTPQKEIDRRIQIINEYLSKQPDIGTYVKGYNDAYVNYAFGLTVVRAQMDNLRQQLGELPAGFADDIRRRGDALHKAAKVIDDFYRQVFLLIALPGGDVALYMLMKLSAGFSSLGDGLYDFAYWAGGRQDEYRQEIQRLETQADKLNSLRGAFDVIYPKSSP